MAVAGKTTGRNDNLARKTSKSSFAGRNAGKGKNGTRRSSASKTKKTGKGTDTGKKNLERINEFRDYQAFETGITIVVMGIVSFLLYLSFFSLAGNAGTVIGGLVFGIFGWYAWFLPVTVIVGYIFILVNAGDKRITRKAAGLTGMILSILALTDLIFNNDTILEYYKINHVTHKGYFDAMFLACKNVMEWGRFNGGLLGRAFGGIFSVILGRVGATLILFALLIFFGFVFYGVEALSKIRKRNAYRQEMDEIYEQVKEDEEYIEPSYRVFTFHENRNQWKKPMRELTRVPKVQSFDLRGQADFFDGKAGKKTEEKKIKSEGPVISEEEKKEDRKTAKDTKKPEQAENLTFEKNTETSLVPDAAEAYKGSDDTETEKAPGTSAGAETAAEPEVKEDVEKKEEIADIPIYRDELEKKFGHAREHQEIEKTELQTIRRMESEGFGEEESAFERFARKKREAVIQKEQEDSGTVEAVSAEVVFPESVSPETDFQEEQEKESDMEDDLIETAFREEYEEDRLKETAFREKYKEDSLKEDFSEEEKKEIHDDAETAFWEEKQDAFYDETISGKAAEEENDVLETSENIEDDFSDSVMIMDDFIPQTPPASFRPKQESRQNVMDDGINARSASLSGAEQPSGNIRIPEGRNRISETENGSRVFSDFSSYTQTREKEKKEEPKIEKPYEFPSIELLEIPKKGSGTASDEELRATALKLQETLESFNVKVKMGAVTCGPSVTRYELLPEQGVRVNKITNLADDLKLSLAAQSIRIEAPIPGKAAVGIEVPNAVASAVSFRELLEGEAFENSKSPLTFAVGKDIAGKLIMADIAKMPHLLIAGATGSGKSVCINTLIMSILYKADPKDVKLIMIDPKVVELSCYNGIPHLFCPVVTDPKEAAASLNWAVREMMDRYNKFEELKVRNIAGYNEKIKKIDGAEEQGYVKMPYLVVIVDEFADLMMVASKDVEDAVCRLAQLARAAGIHLVLATQRPSVNVITGVIKANIPSRIAFSVSSAIDSRTILDRGGAEKLLGKGDMLFFPSGYTEPVRVQGAFVSDQEVTDVVEFLCDTNDAPEYNNEVTEIAEEPVAETVPEKKPQSDRDEYFEDAGRFVIESERAAAGQLQRHFSIGFNRAGRIIDQLEKAGVVGPAAGTKPRAVLMNMEEFEMMLNGGPAEMDMMEEAL